MSCDGDCSHCSMREACGSGGVPDAMKSALQDVKDSLSSVKHKILVLSGKGGVGKSTVTYLISKILSDTFNVGVLDLDLCGPSMPLLFNSDTEALHPTAFGLEPKIVGNNISLVSVQFFLDEADTPVIARGPMKNSLVLQFLKDIDWGETEVLVVDTPPGTSDEHLSVVSFMNSSGIDGAILVTTPEEVALSDVRRELKFCRKAGVKVLGVIENMSEFVCPLCNEKSYIYPRTTGGASSLCDSEGLSLLGRLPIDPSLVAGCVGELAPISDSVTESLSSIKANLLKSLGVSATD